MAEKISMDKLPKWMKNMQGISEIPFYRNKGQSIEWISKKLHITTDIVESVLDNYEEYINELCGWDKKWN
ncbi:MAG TPA: hypothetical protein VMV43_00315 [Candidatus Nanopelagicaceae bacterium]|nr:hypothetical protein [Candidatus Nanopelagicaceae bacterium]